MSLKRRTFQLLTAEVHIQSYHSKCWKLINLSAFFYMVSAYLLSCSQTFRSYPRAGTSSIAVSICSEHLLKCFPLELHCLKKFSFLGCLVVVWEVWLVLGLCPVLWLEVALKFSSRLFPGQTFLWPLVLSCQCLSTWYAIYEALR